MATLEERIKAAYAKVTLKLNTLKNQIGNLPGLSTADQTSLVAAINEVKGIADVAAGGGVSLDDSGPSLTKTWSSAKISAEVTAAIAAALEGEDLSDLADAIGNLQVTDQGLVSVTNSQSFNTAQQAQARANIGAASAAAVGNTDYDFEADIDSALTF